MGDKRFQKPGRGYQRTLEKAATQVAVAEELYEEGTDFFDPEIESPHVAGGDPGLATLMAEAAEQMLADPTPPDH